jgi:tripartite-type tricarboxylate transporter receptor subunit TctC
MIRTYVEPAASRRSGDATRVGQGRRLLRQLRSILLAAFLVSAFAACTSNGGGEGGAEGANSEDYPSDDMTLLIPYTAGGPTDLAGRSVASYFEREFGQTVVVENQPGASGAQATNSMLDAEADGHTLMVFTGGTAVITPMSENLDYGPEDIAPIGLMTEIPSVLAVRGDSEYETAEDFFAAAEENPGQLNVGTPGASTPQAIELRRLADEYEVEVSQIPFQGNAEMTSALLGGNVDAVFINASEDVLANIEGDDFRPLALSLEERVEYLPDTPTLVELGYEELTLGNSFFALGAPADTPEEIIGKLESTMEEALQDEEVREQLGEEYISEEFVGAEALRERLNELQVAYEPILQE